jgi:hypothetical protein
MSTTFGNSNDSDEAYLAESSINFYVRNLFTQVAALKPDDPIEFASRYFKRIHSCHHVLGADYAYICATKSNRRAFIFCLMEILVTFPLDVDMSASEYQQIIEMICPDFPKRFVLDAAAAIGPSSGRSESESSNMVSDSLHGVGGTLGGKYRHSQFRIALHFFIIFEEWIKYIETIFREEGSLDCLSTFRLKAYLDDCRKNWSASFSQPTSDAVDTALATIKSSEISFAALLRALFACPSVQADVTAVSVTAVPLLSLEAEKKKGGKAKTAAGPGPAPASASASVEGTNEY